MTDALESDDGLPSDEWLYRPIEPGVKPTHAQLVFSRVVYAAQMLARDNVAITAKSLNQFNAAITVRAATLVLATERFAQAMDEQGIRLYESPLLEADQMAALAIYMDMSVPLTHAQKLKAAGVSPARWNGWMRQREFARRINELAADVMRDSVPVAKQRIAQLVDSGNLPAITLALEMEGIHDRRKETVDVQAILRELFSILDEEVADIAVLDRIASKIKQRMMGQAPILRISPRELEDGEPT